MSAAAFHREHCRRRARQRLGVKLTRNAHATILADIRSGRATLIERKCSNDSRSIFMVSICGRACCVVYCRRLDDLITILHRGKTV